MSWTESASPSFTCRHSSRRASDAARVLGRLERAREELAEHFPPQPDAITVVLHDTPLALALANPGLAAVWAGSAAPVRRYVAGWVGTHELHVFSPTALRERASGVSGSFEMLELAPTSLYAKRVIVDTNRELQSASAMRRFAAELRWAWLIEGSARWLSGENDHSRAVVGRYLRSGHRPGFPPGWREAPLLGPTLIALVAERGGAAAVARLAGRLHSDGPRAALLGAFPGEGLSAVESEWRSRLRHLAEGG